MTTPSEIETAPPAPGRSPRTIPRRACEALLRSCLPVVLAAAPIAVPAQEEPPRFLFTDRAPEERAEWKAKAQAGLAASAGNSRALSISGSLSGSRRQGDDQLSGDASVAFARSRAFIAAEQDGIPGIGPGELRAVDQTTTQAWKVGARYDRFFARRNSVYFSASMAADRPAGKRLLAGGQVGYRRVLYGTAKRQLAVEGGYDLTHREYVGAGTPIEVHSGRIFVGWHSEPDPTFGLETSVDVLTNLGPENTPTGCVAPLHDDRVTGVFAATAKFSERGSVGLRLSAWYDSAPAPRPPPPGAGFEPGFAPLAERLDARAELALIWQLL